MALLRRGTIVEGSDHVPRKREHAAHGVPPSTAELPSKSTATLTQAAGTAAAAGTEPVVTPRGAGTSSLAAANVIEGEMADGVFFEEATSPCDGRTARSTRSLDVFPLTPETPPSQSEPAACQVAGRGRGWKKWVALHEPRSPPRQLSRGWKKWAVFLGAYPESLLWPGILEPLHEISDAHALVPLLGISDADGLEPLLGISDADGLEPLLSPLPRVPSAHGLEPMPSTLPETTVAQALEPVPLSVIPTTPPRTPPTRRAPRTSEETSSPLADDQIKDALDALWESPDIMEFAPGPATSTPLPGPLNTHVPARPFCADQRA